MLKYEGIIRECLGGADGIRRCGGYALRGCVGLYEATGEAFYRDLALGYAHGAVMPDGGPAFDPGIAPDTAADLGRALFFAWDETGEARYRRALDGLQACLTDRFCRIDACPDRGLIAVQPFLAEYDKRFGGRKNAAAAAALFKRAHPVFRSEPWYLAALIDTIGSMDEQIYEHCRALIDLFREAAAGAVTPGGVFAVYALLKGVRLDLLDGDIFQAPAKKAFEGLAPDGSEGFGAYMAALSELRRQRWNY